MHNSFTVRGTGGEVRFGYQPAFVLGRWTLEAAGPGGSVIEAEIENEHQLYAARRPLDVWLPIATVSWLWRNVDVHTRGSDGVTIHVTGRPTIVPHGRSAPSLGTPVAAGTRS